MAEHNERFERLAESTRVEAFSDGVFAIALTLLVLDLHAPADARGGFTKALLDQWPAYIAYLAAFLNIAAIWLNHHALFTRVRHVDVRLMCANLILLLVASLFPWPASVISAAVRDGNRADQVSALVLYAVVGFFVPVAWTLLYGYLIRSPHLLTSAGDVTFVRNASRRSVASLVAYPIAGALASVAPIVSLIAYPLLPLFFIGTLLYPKRPGVKMP